MRGTLEDRVKMPEKAAFLSPPRSYVLVYKAYRKLYSQLYFFAGFFCAGSLAYLSS